MNTDPTLLATSAFYQDVQPVLSAHVVHEFTHAVQDTMDMLDMVKGDLNIAAWAEQLDITFDVSVTLHSTLDGWTCVVEQCVERWHSARVWDALRRAEDAPTLSARIQANAELTSALDRRLEASQRVLNSALDRFARIFDQEAS